MDIGYKTSIYSLDKETAVKDLLQLEIGEECFYPESDYGHGFIGRVQGGFECWSIPMYGGEPSLEDTFTNAEDAFAEVQSWC